jgi:plasmid maintenance system antidote protein VapI
MKERGMRVKDLADEIGHTAFATKKILDGSRRIDDHFAKALANVFGTTSDFWVSLERNFQRALRGE